MRGVGFLVFTFALAKCSKIYRNEEKNNKEIHQNVSLHRFEE